MPNQKSGDVSQTASSLEKPKSPIRSRCKTSVQTIPDRSDGNKPVGTTSHTMEKSLQPPIKGGRRNSHWVVLKQKLDDTPEMDTQTRFDLMLTLRKAMSHRLTGRFQEWWDKEIERKANEIDSNKGEKLTLADKIRLQRVVQAQRTQQQAFQEQSDKDSETEEDDVTQKTDVVQVPSPTALSLYEENVERSHSGLSNVSLKEHDNGAVSEYEYLVEKLHSGRSTKLSGPISREPQTPVQVNHLTTPCPTPESLFEEHVERSHSGQSNTIRKKREPKHSPEVIFSTDEFKTTNTNENANKMQKTEPTEAKVALRSPRQIKFNTPQTQTINSSSASSNTPINEFNMEVQMCLSNPIKIDELSEPVARNSKYSCSDENTDESSAAMTIQENKDIQSPNPSTLHIKTSLHNIHQHKSSEATMLEGYSTDNDMKDNDVPNSYNEQCVTVSGAVKETIQQNTERPLEINLSSKQDNDTVQTIISTTEKTNTNKQKKTKTNTLSQSPVHYDHKNYTKTETPILTPPTGTSLKKNVAPIFKSSTLTDVHNLVGSSEGSTILEANEREVVLASSLHQEDKLDESLKNETSTENIQGEKSRPFLPQIGEIETNLATGQNRNQARKDKIALSNKEVHISQLEKHFEKTMRAILNCEMEEDNENDADDEVIKDLLYGETGKEIDKFLSLVI